MRLLQITLKRYIHNEIRSWHGGRYLCILNLLTINVAFSA